MSILGDFNINTLEQRSNRKWLNSVRSFSCHQLISEPTRVTETSSTPIDHVYTNSPSDISESGIIKYDMSDHYLIFIKILFSTLRVKAKRISFKFNDYSKFTNQNIHKLFSGRHFNDVLCENTVDRMYARFTDTYSSLIKTLVITKKRFVKTAQLPKWLDDEVKSHMHLHDRLRREGKWEEYEIQRNYVKNLIKKKKKSVIFYSP